MGGIDRLGPKLMMMIIFFYIIHNKKILTIHSLMNLNCCYTKFAYSTLQDKFFKPPTYPVTPFVTWERQQNSELKLVVKRILFFQKNAGGMNLL